MLVQRLVVAEHDVVQEPVTGTLLERREAARELLVALAHINPTVAEIEAAIDLALFPRPGEKREEKD